MSNYQFIIGSILVPIVAAFLGRGYLKRRKEKKVMEATSVGFSKQEFVSTSPNTEIIKGKVAILFIDDDTKFKVVNILRNSGWTNTKAVKDIKNLDDQLVRDTDIFFVDIQGVGLALQFNDEGLGLALALKRKYPNKKVVIYSAETKGDRFHKALRNADSFLYKNAEPYEFQQIVEQFSMEIIQ